MMTKADYETKLADFDRQIPDAEVELERRDLQKLRDEASELERELESRAS